MRRADIARSRAAILRLLEAMAAHGWQDEHGRPVSPEVARDAAAVLRMEWSARDGGGDRG